jgi:type IV pilus assembly protein PilY1
MKNLISNKKLVGIFSAISMLFMVQGQAATVSLATSPLIKTPTANIQPNILFVLDDSGSMDWTFLPDAANNFTNAFGYMSSHCNGVAFDPTYTYKAPVTSAPPVNGVFTRYANASFSSAKEDGFDSGSTSRNLDTYTYQTGNAGAVYYVYKGTQVRDFSSNTFTNECDTTLSDTTTGLTTYVNTNSLFERHRLSPTMTTTITLNGIGTSTSQVTGITVNGVQIMSGASATASGISAPTFATNITAKINQNGYSATVNNKTITITGPATAANYAPVISYTNSMGSITFETDVFPETNATKLTNYANWFSFYHSRLLTMKTSAGEAFSSIDNRYRLGFMTINQSKPSLGVGTFESTQRTDWYSKLYNTNANNSTPLRAALSTAGRYYANKLTGDDPVQYSCQQNFTLLSTDGYWNGNEGVKMDGSTTVGNQDNVANRPQFDGTGATFTVTYQYTNQYLSSSGCNGGKKRLYTENIRGTCEATSASASCSPTTWATVSTNNTSCKNTLSVQSPNPSTATEIARAPSGNGGYSDSLADVAQYYYTTDLRDAAFNNCTGGTRLDGTTGDVCENNVAGNQSDTNKNQHMNTFTLGLGAEGKMKFLQNYENNEGDYLYIKRGDLATATKCNWDGTTIGEACNWPNNLGQTVEQNIDDLWHAAVNGRGTYFNAQNPAALTSGIKEALVGIGKAKGSAAAASSSSLNPVYGDNSAFIASYVNKDWVGNVESRKIDTTNATTSFTATWCAEDIEQSSCATALVSQTVNNATNYYCETPQSSNCVNGGGENKVSLTGSGVTMCRTPAAAACTGTFTTPRKNSSLATYFVSPSSDTRTIKTSAYNTTLNKYELVEFDAAFATANASYFNSSKLSNLTQWSSLTAAQQVLAEANILSYLRGQYAYDQGADNVVTVGTVTTDNRIFRQRKSVLGDILESKPTFHGSSLFTYGYPGYENFKTTKNANANVTAGTVYVGANDGMLHALNANNGKERWAYIPSMVVPNLWRLADSDYPVDGMHVNYINGSPAIGDVCTANCTDAATAVWKTILVGGLNAGDRGYYALDITNPDSPTLLWELTTTSGIGSTKDDDIGFGYAKPILTRTSSGNWVVLVTSGYNNTSPGSGKGYLYALNAGTGAVVKKISTGVGSATSPSGLGKIAAWNNDSNGNQSNLVYGGDLEGNLWRFDLDATTTADVGTGSAFKFAYLDSTNPATVPQAITTTPILGLIGGNKVIYVATGKYLETSDLSVSTATQSIYAIKDNGSTTTLNNPRAFTSASPGKMVKQTLTVSSSDTDKREVTSVLPVDWANDRGWFVDLPASSERVYVDGVLIQGVLVYPSIVPTSSACNPGGYGYLNYLDYSTGGNIQGFVSTRYNSPIVGIGVINIGGDSYINTVTADSELNPADIKITGKAGSFSGTRTLWREILQ